MDKQAELVRRLVILEEFLCGAGQMVGHSFGDVVNDRPYWWRPKMREYLTDAIAYIQATQSRDEVLEEAVQAVVHCNTSKIGAASAIRALKAKPFTRTDGTTSPERGTVEDRRKSAYGNATEGVRRGYDYSKLGRRSGDRARWIGEAAPVVECDTGSESMIEAEQPGYKYAVHLLKAIASKHFGDGPKVKPLPSIDGVLTQIDHLTASMVRERPTQEAPVWEKPTEWVDERFTIESTGQFNYEVQCYAFTLRAFAEHLERYIEQQIDAAFDARQGEK